MKIRLKMTTIILLFLSWSFCQLPAAISATAQEQSGQMTVNLDGVLLKDFIMFVSRFTGRNIVFRDDQVPASKVSIHAQAPMSEPELLAVFESILASNNLGLVARGDVYYVLQSPVIQAMSEPFFPVPEHGEDQELITSVIQLEPTVPIKQAAEFLKPFISRYGMLQEIAPARALLIRDTRQNILKISDIIDTVQKLGPKWQTRMMALDQADAKKAASKVMELYQGLMERGQMGSAPVILPVEWSNSLMVAGTPDQIETVRGLIMDLDNIAERTAGLKIYSLKNARAEAAAEVLRHLLSAEGANEDNPDGKSRMVVSPDKETNSILVMADPQFLHQVDEVVKHLDQPLAQVFVEALIVETTLEHSQDFGVEWLVGGGGTDGFVTGGFVAPESRLGPLMSVPAPPIAAGGFSIGALGNTVTFAGRRFSTLGALVNFLKSATDFNILSTPQIMTLDNSEAEIFIGENRPFVVSERIDPQSNVIQTFDYRDVGIRLLVTPIINTETSMIRLQVEQEVKNVLLQTETLAPVTMNRNTRTNVQLPSGSTMVISGLIENEFTHTRRAVPGLSKVPGFGWLFRREVLSAPKTTLMVFLSARIIETLEQADHLTDDRKDRLRHSRDHHEEILEREFWGVKEQQKKSFHVDMDQLGPAVISEDHE
jgi:general secretion pathway protein D